MAALLGASSGLTVTGTSYIGAATQAGIYTDFDLDSSDPGEPTLRLDDGILLTSGDAGIGETNTSGSFFTFTGTGGSALVEAELAGVRDFERSHDQNVLSFTFTPDDPETTSISTKFVFGSDEFSEDDRIADAFTFFVDGVNYAELPGGIPIVSQMQELFVADNENDSYGIEYDGLTNVLTLVGFLDPALDEHTVSIIVTDGNDPKIDSGVFLAGLSAGTDTGGGVDPGPGPIPLPAALPLLLGALGGLGLLRRRAGRA